MQTQNILSFSSGKVLGGVTCAKDYNTRHDNAIYLLMDIEPKTRHRLARELLPYLETLANLHYLLSQLHEQEKVRLLELSDQTLRGMVSLVNAELDR